MKISPDFRATGMRRRNVRLFLLQLVVLVLLVWQPQQGYAAPAALKNLHGTIAVEKYDVARQQAQAMLRGGDAAIRAQLARPLGRILLATGDTKAVESYFKALKKAKLDSEAQELVDVYQLWAQGVNGQPEVAIAGLQKIVELDKPTYGALEAADILAILQLQRGQRAAAQQTVNKALQVIAYNEFEDPYIARLLKGRMSSKWFVGGGKAERLYNEAEALRSSVKFAAAGKLYARVQSEFPESVFADASNFRIGECFVGLGQPARAEAHWREFIDAEPKGPWRGQAHAALAEMSLIRALDLESATEQLQKAANAFELGVEEESLASWRQAATQFYLDQGIIAISHRDYATAVTALANAWRQRGHGHAHVARHIERFQKIAGERTDVLPAELYLRDQDAQAICGVGKLLVIMQRYDDAKQVFGGLLQGPKASRSATHRSYGAQELARLHFRAEEYPLAKRGYQYSLEQYKKAPWHDDTLRELALLIERHTREAHRAQAASLAKATAGQGGAQLSDKQRHAQRQVYLKGRAEAVPYWLGIFQRYPDSPHVPQALFHMGRLYVEANKSEWAATSFEKLTSDYPSSAWTGDAHVWLLDIKLERQYDLAGARQHATAAIGWLSQLDREAAEHARNAIIGSEAVGLRSLRGVTYDIYVRGGLVEYLDQQYATAAARFAEAQRYTPSRRVEVAYGTIPTGIERLIRAAKTGESITPEAVLEGDSQARLMLMLADLYHEGQQHREARQLCDRVVRGAAPSASEEQLSWAHFKRGRSGFSLEGKAREIDSAYQDYLAAAKLAPEADWADNALFLAANMHWNFHQDVDGAVRLWRQLIETHPESDEAPRAAYFIGVAYQWSGRLQRARAAYQDALSDFPQSQFNELVRTQLLRTDEEIDRRRERATQPPQKTRQPQKKKEPTKKDDSSDKPSEPVRSPSG